MNFQELMKSITEEGGEQGQRFIENLQKQIQNTPGSEELFNIILETIMKDQDMNGGEMVDAIVVDDKNYVAINTISIQGAFYTMFTNEEDATDFTIMRCFAGEDGENEYYDLESEYEKNLVLAYQLKFIWQEVQKKLEEDIKELEQGL